MMIDPSGYRRLTPLQQRAVDAWLDVAGIDVARKIVEGSEGTEVTEYDSFLDLTFVRIVVTPPFPWHAVRARAPVADSSNG